MNKKILFVVGHSGLKRHFYNIINEASIKNNVVLVIPEVKFNSPIYNIKISKKVEVLSYKTNKNTNRLKTIIRLLIAYKFYFLPKHPSRNLKERILKKNKILKNKILNPFLKILPLNFLIFIDKLTLVNKDISEIFIKYKPDLCITSPCIWPNSPDIEFQKYCFINKIECHGIIPSWDNLVTKSTVIYPMSSIAVWNKDLKKDLIDIHNIQYKNIITSGAFVFEKLLNNKINNKLIAKNNKIKILYLGSSPSIINRKNEDQIINKIRIFCSPELLLTVRYHPLNMRNNKTLKNIENDIQENDIVIGLNTSSFIESAILDKPIIFINIDFKKIYQKKIFSHYKYLTKHNFMYMLNKIDELPSLINKIIKNDELKTNRAEFVKNFILGDSRNNNLAKNYLKKIIT